MAASEPRPEQQPRTKPRQPADTATGTRGLDALFYGLTIAIFAATVVTDLFVVIEHWLNKYKSWAYYTVCLAVVPSCFVQILSLKWYQTTGDLKKYQWISHILQFAVIHRFCFLLTSAIKTMKTQVNPQQRDCILRLENDAFTLNLFTSMLVSVPQIILQVYIMAILQHISFWTSATVVTSLCSVTWSLIAYGLLASRPNHQDGANFTWSSMMTQGCWRGGVLVARIAALVLAVMCFKTWILVIFGIHTLGMTVWIIQQTTCFSGSAMEELAYKCLIGAVYFFDFLRLTSNQSRYHVCLFYGVMTVQNVVFYGVYLVSFRGLFQSNVLIVASVAILGGTFLGALSMLIHFCMFQSVKTIKLCKRLPADPELSLKLSPTKSTGGKSPSKKWNNETSTNESAENVTVDVTADKKSLLTNIVQNADSVEKGIINASFAKSDETNVTVQVVVEDNKIANVDVSIEKLQAQCVTDKELEASVEVLDQAKSSSTDSLHRQKRRGICSEVELDFKSNECNLEIDTQLCSQKRRAICSLTQLGLELVTDEDNYVEKSFSLDKLKTNSDVSLNIEDKSLDSGILDALPVKNLVTGDNCDLMIPENILVRGRLNTPVISESGETSVTNQLSEKANGGQKQEEETMSHVTSIHDYENLCPLGVARPPWCIRSWKGYMDIETYIHDDSVVRDRRRDTLTSTATGTTASSDLSDATYASLPQSLRKFMRRSRQDDYLDTLIYDLVDWESISNRAHNEDVSTTTTSEYKLDNDESQQEQTNLFSAKPIVIDERGGMLSLDTILEEREEQFPELMGKPSSLVATIDEIRRCTAENSPRLVYHRTESQWEDLEQRIALAKRTQLARVLFASEPRPILTNTTAAGDRLSLIREMTTHLKDATGRTPLINAILSDSPILGPKTDAQTCEPHELLEEDNVYVDMNALGAQKCSTEVNKESESRLAEVEVSLSTNLAKAMNKDISNDKCDGGNRKKVAFSLTDEVIDDASDSSTDIQGEACPTKEEFSNPANRPRRKFSLLRERFEPKSIERTADKRISDIFNGSQAPDKENLTGSVIPATLGTLKEKRGVFLKQVLSPPKFHGWGKKRTFSPNAKILPKAH